MFFLSPRHVKQGRALLKDAHKLLAYKRDLWSEEAVTEFEAGIQKLERAIKGRSREPIETAAVELDQLAGKQIQPQSDAAIRENCEVFLVAIVVALGVRTFFLQPFTIPTGSMQPTLNGILAHRTEEPAPNVLVQIFQKVALGRTWVDVVAKKDDTIFQEMTETSLFGFFTRTRLRGQNATYTINCPQDTLRHFSIPFGPVKEGTVIARGYYDTGDHVFVDKFTYHFRKPQRGEVFVFNTKGIPTRDNIRTLMQGPSQFYIKRLAGLPGDSLQIRSPELLINGQRPEEPSFQRVIAAQNGYQGYSNEMSMKYLTSPSDVLTLPEKSYFALGDNSRHSSDSRDWGFVPEQNIVGRGVLVYWPFTSHWGLIK